VTTRRQSIAGAGALAAPGLYARTGELDRVVAAITGEHRTFG
jgi:hypothetical protein